MPVLRSTLSVSALRGLATEQRDDRAFRVRLPCDYDTLRRSSSLVVPEENLNAPGGAALLFHGF
jgi:hypothetical protein